jgi:ATP-binding cassette subfamily B protein
MQTGYMYCKKGDIVETGQHEQLLEEKGLYFAMWRQQIGERKIKTIAPVQAG